MSSKQGWCRSIYFVLSVAIALRIVAMVYWEYRLDESQRFGFGDSDGYWQLAERIAHGGPYQYGSKFASVFRTPGYPLFLSPLFLIWNEPPVLAARLLGCLAGVLSVWLVWRIARLLFDEKIARFAAWLAALYPGGIAISILVLAEALFMPLMLAQLWATVAAFSGDKQRSLLKPGLVAGFFNGLACLTRPSWLLFSFFLLLVGWLIYGDRKRQIHFALLTLVATACVMAPWWIRNYQLTGRLVLTSLQTGTSLYDGLNDRATGASDMTFAPIMVREYLQVYRDNDLGPESEFEYSFNELMKKRAFDWAVSHPGRVGELAGIKFVRIWNPLPNNNEIGSPLMRWGIACYFIPMILLALGGAIRYRGNFVVISVCLFPAIYFTGLHMIFVGSIRYRQPPMMVLLVLSAAMLAKFFAWRFQRDEKKVKAES